MLVRSAPTRTARPPSAPRIPAISPSSMVCVSARLAIAEAVGRWRTTTTPSMSPGLAAVAAEQRRAQVGEARAAADQRPPGAPGRAAELLGRLSRRLRLLRALVSGGGDVRRLPDHRDLAQLRAGGLDGGADVIGERVVAGRPSATTAISRPRSRLSDQRRGQLVGERSLVGELALEVVDLGALVLEVRGEALLEVVGASR